MIKDFRSHNSIENGSNDCNDSGYDDKLQSLKQEACQQAGNDDDNSDKGNPFEISGIHGFSPFSVTGISGILVLSIGFLADFIPKTPGIPQILDIRQNCLYTEIMITAKVYRNGPAIVGNHCTSIVEAWEGYDQHKPSGYSGRLNSIYASPSLDGVIRWVRSNHMAHYSNPDYDLTTYEITVDAENTFVYSVEIFDRLFSYDPLLEDQAKEYWDSGIRLSDWELVSKERKLDPSAWEVLIDPANIKSVKKVTEKRLIMAVPEWKALDFKEMLRNRKEFVKWCNWEQKAA